MKPILLYFNLPLLGRVDFPAYFTMLALGLGLAMLITVREARKLDLDPDEILDINLYMIIFGVVGARLLHVIADGHFMEYVHLCVAPDKVPAVDALTRHCLTDKECGYGYLCDVASGLCHPPQDCLAWAKVWRGGLAYYGGLLVATGYAIYYTKSRGISFLRVADLAAPAIALGLFFGRLGCYLNGCCYGKATSAAIGITFPRGSAPWQAQLDDHVIQSWQPMLPVHPTQLYESLGCMAIFAATYYYIRPRKRHEGQVLAALLILYAVLRSACEVFRDDERGVLFGWLSTSQIISAPLLGLGLYLWWRRPAPLTKPKHAAPLL